MVQQILDQWATLDVDEVFHRSGLRNLAAMTQELDPDEINNEGARAFYAAHGAQSEYNILAMIEWCTEKDVPCTCRNLEIAMADIKSNGQWDYAVTPTETVDSDSTKNYGHVIRRRRTPDEPTPVANDPAKLRTMPLADLKKLIESERRQNAAPQRDVVIMEEGETPQSVTETVAESGPRKMNLADLKKRVQAERIANSTHKPIRTVMI